MKLLSLSLLLAMAVPLTAVASVASATDDRSVASNNVRVQSNPIELQGVLQAGTVPSQGVYVEEAIIIRAHFAYADLPAGSWVEVYGRDGKTVQRIFPGEVPPPSESDWTFWSTEVQGDAVGVRVVHDGSAVGKPYRVVVDAISSALP